MTKREQAIAACMTFPLAYEDYPFDDKNWTAMRHRENQRVFAFIFERQGKIWINLKAQPQWGEVWRQAFPSVLPAYHMNKQHWISVVLDGGMKDGDILRLIGESFELTAPKKGKKDKNKRPEP